MKWCPGHIQVVYHDLWIFDFDAIENQSFVALRQEKH